MKIGLALSGGGFRATVFHLGLLDRLSASNNLEDVSFISTVSGGSLCAGLIYGINGYKWPSSNQYRVSILPEIRNLITKIDLEMGLKWKAVRAPHRLFKTRANDLSDLLKKHWGITANLNKLSQKPRWILNATCSETGRNWRFESKRMGDYEFGYVLEPRIPISEAMSASAGYPVLIGPLILDADRFSWIQYKTENETYPYHPVFDKVHLWDGGIYDNLGIEPLFKVGKGYKKNVDFLIVSDASGTFSPETYRRGVKALNRLISITTYQVRSLRARAIVQHLSQHGESGAYIQIGNTCEYILKRAGRESEINKLCSSCLAENDVRRTKQFPTSIKNLTDTEFDLIYRHGYEVANHTLYAYNEKLFDVTDFNNPF